MNIQGYTEATKSGLVSIGAGCTISKTAVFDTSDLLGNDMKIVIGNQVRIGHNVLINGGATIGDRVVIEENTIVGKPEFGYAGPEAVTAIGRGHETFIGSDVTIRAGAILYAGTAVGARAMLGHNVLLRTNASVGERSQVAFGNSIERGAKIGAGVRMSPLSHITGNMVVEDDVFIGAGVVTVNDKSMVWEKDPDRKKLLNLNPPYIERGARVGSGCTLGYGVRIGKDAIIGSGSLVLRDVPPSTKAFGSPAVIR